MKLVFSTICVSSWLLASFSLFQHTAAQCFTSNDDMTKLQSSTDLSGILDFNLQLFRELIPSDVKRNFIFSPYSIWNALTLAYFGASGRTEEQLRKVLRLDDKLSTLKKWRALEYMYKRRPETSVNNTFITANRAYFDVRITLRSCMEDILHNEIEKIDFKKPQEASAHINDFVSQTTKGTIKEIVSPADVERSQLVLANAAYFKGVWKTKFDKMVTRPASFVGLDGTQYVVDMMELEGEFKYGYNHQLKVEVLELPYSGNSISMLILKPFQNTQDDFNTMIQGLSMSTFEEIIDKMHKTKIEVKIPKFSLDTYCGEELMQALTKMGLTDLFSKKDADFTTFTLDRQINLDRSIHKAFINVDEEGTVAAATTIVVSTKQLGKNSFECNRTFLFIIRDNETKNLLFMGAYKSSDRTDQSFKPTREPDDSNLFPQQDKVNININPTAPIPGNDGEYIPTIVRGNKNPKPVIPFQEESTNIFSHDRFPTPSPDRIIPSFGQRDGSDFVRGSNQSPDRVIPSTGENRGSSPGRDSDQDIERNSLSPGKNNRPIPDRGSDQNIDRNNHSSGGNNGPIPGRGSDQNLDRNFPFSGGNSGPINGRDSVPNRNQNIPSSEGNNRPFPDKGSDQNLDRNIPSPGGNSEPIRGRDSDRDISSSRGNSGFIPGRGSDQNDDPVRPSLVRISGLSSNGAANLNPNLNIQTQRDREENRGSMHLRRNSRRSNQNNPYSGESRESRENNRRFKRDIPTLGENENKFDFF